MTQPPPVGITCQEGGRQGSGGEQGGNLAWINGGQGALQRNGFIPILALALGYLDRTSVWPRHNLNFPSVPGKAARWVGESL